MGVVVIASHACTLAYGIGSIIWEKFYSKEQRLIKALEKKNTNLRKQRMKKFSRARKNLMAGIRGNLAMKKNGGGLGAVVSGVGAKNKGEKKSDGLNFEWPQNGKVEKQLNTDKKSGSSSEESEVDLDHWSSDSYAGSEVDHNDSIPVGLPLVPRIPKQTPRLPAFHMKVTMAMLISIGRTMSSNNNERVDFLVGF